MALFVDLVALSNGLHGSVQMDLVALFSWIGWLRHHGIFKDLLLVADCNYHVFFKSEIANISGLPYEEIQKEQLKDYLNMTVLRVDQEWNITIG